MSCLFGIFLFTNLKPPFQELWGESKAGAAGGPLVVVVEMSVLGMPSGLRLSGNLDRGLQVVGPSAVHDKKSFCCAMPLCV